MCCSSASLPTEVSAGDHREHLLWKQNALTVDWFHREEQDVSDGTNPAAPRYLSSRADASSDRNKKETLMATTGTGTPAYGSSATKPVGSGTHEVKDDVDAIRRDIASLADTVSKLATEKFGTTAHDVQASAEQKLGSLEAAIRQSPTQSAMIAVGVGFLFGLILTR
jgi:ElaB/YqjD/DUF883 family membrane-anchored ribosome-binding protein